MLKNKIAIITGAGNLDGIGFATAKAYIENGAKVVMVDRDERGVATAAHELGANATGICADVRSPQSIKPVFRHVHETFGHLGILVTCAGIAQARKTVDISMEDYDAVMDVNLRGTLLMIQGALPMMQNGASIICMASIAAQRGGGLMGGPHYAASKGAVASLVKSISRDVSPRGVRINAVNPGVILSSMTRDFYDAEMTELVLPSIPIGRFGETRDVAQACVFLASDMSSYITGSAIDVNGGLHMN
ncbi:SDR family NAD(P)-dependent oxidoreductase [Falsihalocynthiibacter arcticus]|uniref:Short-chain dehydrogenase n=1 Tax=Falsihalocynthiibacter arcticus TaxID=1579316 RepID=A0A126UXL7_9RHOB|nr:SDR family oxidoreductase [Falsihalocynthiibacter arcticus]AML50435.1 hypothetical protein RC74_03380 [Falsihalocynthiibacter arcticus]